MSDTLASLRRKINGAGDLESVVRSMKALAASSIGQYEKAVLSLADYYHTVELGLAVCLRQPMTRGLGRASVPPKRAGTASAVVFGSDQGLVGQFNDSLADFVAKTLAAVPGDKKVWAVGDRVADRLKDVGFQPLGVFGVPSAVNAIARAVGQVLVEWEAQPGRTDSSRLYLFHNSPESGAAYQAVSQLLLPLDAAWSHRLEGLAWPTTQLPEVVGSRGETLEALVREYLFVSLYKACAESLASENACRLAAMQRAEQNIDDMTATLKQSFRRLRQASIDEELFDVSAAYESMSDPKGR